MENNSIYGAIKIDRDYANSIAFIKSLGEDKIYPFINTNMFGLGEYVRPFYYENMLITFGTTYKSFGLELIDWNLFILKMEHILRNIDFESAQFHFDSNIGDFVFHWVNKNKVLPHWKDDYKNKEYNLIESEEFYFGFGDRGLTTPYPARFEAELDELSVDEFSYPIKFQKTAVEKVRLFNKRIKEIQIGTKINFETIMNERMDDRVFEILYDLKLKGFYDINEYYGDVTLYKHVDL
ncbi:hypothetical protein A5893_17145 [Pedobacter psychrophilus]|uniref:Uncharacterized protein n=1 Tax=Pedobacter psychrophilus TaxID=1826909 RepID=A0A179DRN3_9SPHI|nr:hypothetical protein [Pedobacter psychrophilus]OAQ43512.1 hypothetical protein A5893_17145 [Pedobacter psychrophilus]